VYQDGVFERGKGIFSNGFRYLNWLTDVPLLLLQLVVVLGLAAAGARRLVILFAGSGVAVIVLGYIGQFSEATNVTALWIWGAEHGLLLVLLYSCKGRLAERYLSDKIKGAVCGEGQSRVTRAGTALLSLCSTVERLSSAAPMNASPGGSSLPSREQACAHCPMRERRHFSGALLVEQAH
jgi:hypothetical protein